MKKLLNKNNIWLGVALGIILPIISYGIFNLLAGLSADKGAPLMEDRTVQVVSIVVNVFLFRYYMLKKKHDETGKGMLLATLILALAFTIKYV